MYSAAPRPFRTMRPPRTKKLLSGLLGLIIIGALWFCFAPAALGGDTSYVVTDGVSMQPRFHTGDLAVVRAQSSYHVGEIVAYNSIIFHTIVLHRIIGRAGSRYVMKGDHNNFVDFEHPRGSQIIGALWLHVPGAGATLHSLRSPALVGILVAFGTLLFAGAAFTKRRRRRGRARRKGEDAKSPRVRMPVHAPVELPAASVLMVAATVLMPFLLLALLAFTRSSSARLPVKVPYQQAGTLSYTAQAPPGPVYPENRAVTGDPLFTQVVRAAEIHFNYLFESNAPHALAGKLTLDATVASTSGWQNTFALGPPAYFHGDHGVISAPLSVTSLLALMERFKIATGASGSYTVTISPHVSSTGTIGRLPLHTTFSPQFPFQITTGEIQPTVAGAPASATAAAQPSPSQFTQSQSGSASAEHSQALDLNLGFVHVPVAGARVFSLVAILLIIASLIAARVLIRPRRREESATIQSRYRRMIVPVDRVWQLPGVAVIDVTDMEALARIAEHYDRSILHETTAEGDAYWVTDESGHFRYALNPQVPEPAEGYAGEHPLTRLVNEARTEEMAVAETATGTAATAVAAPVAPPVAASLAAQQAAEAEDLAARDAADAMMRETNDWNAAWEASSGDRRGNGFRNRPGI